MNKYEAYQLNLPLLTLSDFVGCWVRISELASREIELPRNDRSKYLYIEYVHDIRANWAIEHILTAQYALIVRSISGRIALCAQDYPPSWGCKHITKHPKWGKGRYE